MGTSLFTIVGLTFIAGTVLAVEWDGVVLRFPYYYDIGLTKSSLLASSENYTFVRHDKKMNVDFYAYNKDPRVTIGYDSYGNIAGLRFAYVKADLGKRADENNVTFPTEFYNKPLYKSGRILGNNVYYTDVLFLDPAKLKAGGRSDTGGSSVEDLYIKIKGKWTLIPKNESNQVEGFMKEACYPGMGLHYFNFPTFEECLSMEGFFGLYDQGRLIGLGVTAFGTQGSKSDREWYEAPSFAILKTIAPTQPPCLENWINQYGALSFHIFFKSSAKYTTCSTY